MPDKRSQRITDGVRFTTPLGYWGLWVVGEKVFVKNRTLPA